MSYYWSVVKDMDDSQKLELVTMLIDSVKAASKQEQSDTCIDSAECEQARPEVKPIQTTSLFDTPCEEFPDMDKELYTPEEAYELTMKDIKAIYDKKDAV